ncbi:hypothetical protein AJ79_03786 [Helicocarpus griseus UAMH5409]|uniref:Vps72/YL1 C-terminal domain-containing protein n=1 Tax=Helicocarpus griseus UAMH5409 TaxID=1447875 RepID=A0A2B7XXD8_9EURO|nr:hypothetical protein AJ79_03786 [Helicocarpus griseus UAMH5409]
MADDDPMTDSPAGPDGEPVETLVKGRARRSTAGKHMTALLDAEADDELALLFAEEEDDEEFESGQEEGEEGEGGEEADDMELDSSSDEDDQGPNVQDDDLEGERELQRQAKAEQRLAKKRKEQDFMKLPALRKRVKIDQSAASVSGRTSTTPAPRPKKKSERVSWLPTVEDGPTRSSSRRQTMQNKEMTHARLKDSEEKRVRLIATMEEAARRKEKLKPKVMTQEERLAEAAKTERLNSKSLNRWEEMERRRGEEQKARLDALQNRKLEGAVTTWWSGFAKWINGKLARVGTKDIAQAPDVERKRKGKDADESPKRRGSNKKAEKVEDGVDKGGAAESEPGPASGPTSQTGKTEGEKTHEIKKDGLPQQITFAPPQVPGSFLDGIHMYASMKDDISQSSTAAGQKPSASSAQSGSPPSPQVSIPQKPVSSSSTAPEQPSAAPPGQAPPAKAPTAQETSAKLAASERPDSISNESDSASRSDQPAEQQPQKPFPRIEVQIIRSGGKSPGTPSPSSSQQPQKKQPTPQPPLIHVDENTNINNNNTHNDHAINPQQTQTQAQSQPAPTPDHTHPLQTLPTIQQQEQPQQPSATPAPPPVVEYSSRNLIILENFENKTPQEREQYNIFFNPRKPQKLQKITQDLCPITSRTARYRDPETSLPYANSLAYREIRQTLANRYAWSGLLGCFVGPIGVGARGVPERFLAPNAPPPPVLVGEGAKPAPGDGAGGAGAAGAAGGGSGSGSDGVGVVKG